MRSKYFNNPNMFPQRGINPRQSDLRNLARPQVQQPGGLSGGVPPEMMQRIQQGAGKPQVLPQRLQQMLGQPQRGFGPGVDNFAPQGMGQVPQQGAMTQGMLGGMGQMANPNAPMPQMTPDMQRMRDLSQQMQDYQQSNPAYQQAQQLQGSFAGNMPNQQQLGQMQQLMQQVNQDPRMMEFQNQAGALKEQMAAGALGQQPQGMPMPPGAGLNPAIASMTPEQRMAFGLGSNPVQTLGQSPAMQSLGQVATGQQQVPEWVRLAQQSGNMQNPFAQQAQGMPQPTPSQPPQAVTGAYANAMQQAQGLRNMNTVKPLSAPPVPQQQAQQTQTQPAGISSLGNKPQGGGGLF